MVIFEINTFNNLIQNSDFFDYNLNNSQAWNSLNMCQHSKILAA